MSRWNKHLLPRCHYLYPGKFCQRSTISWFLGSSWEPSLLSNSCIARQVCTWNKPRYKNKAKAEKYPKPHTPKLSQTHVSHYVQTKRSPDLITGVLTPSQSGGLPDRGGTKWLRTEIKVHATGGNVNWISADAWLVLLVSGQYVVIIDNNNIFLDKIRNITDLPTYLCGCVLVNIKLFFGLWVCVTASSM